MNKKSLAFVLFAGFIIFIASSIFFLWSKKQTFSPEGYKSYVLKIKNPSPENAKEIILEALVKEFESCNCLPSGFPKIESDGIRLSEQECDFIGIPGGLASTAFGVEVYILADNVFSRVNSDTLSIFIGDIVPGHFCSDSPFYGLNIKRRETIERAFYKANLKGYENYD